MARLRSFGGTWFMRVSPICKVPMLGASKPAIMRRVVVFPQPEGPTTITNSPSSISRLRLSTATFEPKDLVTVRSAIFAMVFSAQVLAGDSVPVLAFDSAGEGEAAAQPPRADQVEDDHGQGEQHRIRGQLAELDLAVRAHELIDADGAGRVGRIGV